MDASSIQDSKRHKRRNMSVAIHLAIEADQERWPFDGERLRKAAQTIAHDHGLTAGEISLAVVDDAEIQVLNKKYLEHDWPTDAISFVFEQDDDSIDGEVIVSVETAYRLAEKLPWSGNDELLLYVIHGVLHLMGLDDLDEDLATEMRQAERDYLMQFGVPQAEKHGTEVWEENFAASDVQDSIRTSRYKS
jgi:probable rRNA maturation factor